MTTHFKAAALFAVAALVLAMPLAAQNATDALPALESNAYKATSGLFGNDVDNFMDVHSYSDVSPEKWFGFVTGNPLSIDSNPTTGLISLGYARNFGSLYLGLWYQGNVAQVTRLTGDDHTTTTRITPAYDAYRVLTSTTEKTTYKSSWMNTANQIEALIGIGSMGIKVGFFESLFSNKQEGNTIRDVTKTDDKSGLVYYENAIDEFYEKGGYLRPYLGWGASFGSLRPYVNLGLTVKNDAKLDNYSSYYEANGKKVDKQSTVDEGWDRGFVRPEIGIGAWFDIKKESTEVSLGIEYNLGIEIGSSSYEATGLSGDKIKGSVAWGGANSTVKQKTTYLDRTETSTDIEFTIDETSSASHQIIPTYVVSGEPVENLSLGFKAKLPVNLGTWSSDQRSEKHEIDETKFNEDGKTSKVTTITKTHNWTGEGTWMNIALELAVGASYKLNRFAVNAGVSAIPVNFTNEVMKSTEPITDSVTTTKTTDYLGNTTEGKSVTRQDGYDEVAVTNTWNGLSANVTGGFTFFFNEKVALDLAGQWGTNSFKVDVADVSVLLAFKF